jgi:hypothetical protein
MTIEKCPKCGEEYDSLYSLHECEAIEETEKRRKEWEEASGFKKLFMYHPDVPHLLRWGVIWPWNISFAALIFVLPAFLISFNESMYVNNKPVALSGRIAFIGLLGIMLIFSFLFSYGLSRLKKWVMFVYCAFPIFAFIGGFLLTRSISDGIIWGITAVLYIIHQVIIVLFYYKRFS